MSASVRVLQRKADSRNQSWGEVKHAQTEEQEKSKGKHDKKSDPAQRIESRQFRMRIAPSSGIKAAGSRCLYV
jgi:hypothetical protein